MKKGTDFYTAPHSKTSPVFLCTIMQVFITPGEHFSCLKTAVYSKIFYEWVFTREFDNFLNLTNYELNAFIQSVGIPEIPRE